MFSVSVFISRPAVINICTKGWDLEGFICLTMQVLYICVHNPSLIHSFTHSLIHVKVRGPLVQDQFKAAGCTFSVVDPLVLLICYFYGSKVKLNVCCVYYAWLRKSPL